MIVISSNCNVYVLKGQSALKSNGSKKCVARGLPATSNTVNKHATAERKLVAVLATIIVTLW